MPGKAARSLTPRLPYPVTFRSRLGAGLMNGVGTDSNDDVDTARPLAAVRRRWPLIGTVALAAAAGAFALASLATPHYHAETRVLIETRSAQGGAAAASLDDEAVASQVHVISSTDILQAGGAQVRALRQGRIQSAHGCRGPADDRLRAAQRPRRNPDRPAGADRVARPPERRLASPIPASSSSGFRPPTLNSPRRCPMRWPTSTSNCSTAPPARRTKPRPPRPNSRRCRRR